MTVTLMSLPYDHDALAPHISADTLKLHHGAHFKSYVDKVNQAVSETDMSDASLEEIVRSSRGKDAKLFNSAGQAWNHGFYFNSLTSRETSPEGPLLDAIVASFGGFDEARAQLAKVAQDHFGSGWAWLVAERGRLSVVATHDAETPITGSANPLLAIDVWEHAYYLDVQNKRPEHVAAVTDRLLDWEFASCNFARGTPWAYPD